MRRGGRGWHRGRWTPADSAAAGVAQESTLAQAQAGDVVTVQELRGGGRFVQRLLDLGFLPGTPVTVVRRFGVQGPVEVVVQGCRLGMRRAEAERVLVKKG